MQSILCEYGKSLLPGLIIKRKFLYFENPEEIIDDITILGISFKEYEIVKRFHTDDSYNLNWHIDNRQLQKHKMDNDTNNLKMININMDYGITQKFHRIQL